MTGHKLRHVQIWTKMFSKLNPSQFVWISDCESIQKRRIMGKIIVFFQIFSKLKRCKNINIMDPFSLISYLDLYYAINKRQKIFGINIADWEWKIPIKPIKSWITSHPTGAYQYSKIISYISNKKDNNIYLILKFICLALIVDKLSRPS